MTKPVERALITGAGRRVGAAIALELGPMPGGLDVALHVRRASGEADALARRVEAKGCRAQVIACDLANQAQTAALIERAEAALGPVRMLVNNAALFRHDRLADLEIDNLRTLMSVNLEAPLILAREMARRLPDGVTGVIVNMLDQRVVAPTGRYLSYDISKSALWAATRILARDLAPRIRVNAIGPGMVVPPDDGSDPLFEQRVARTPLARRSTEEEIARAVRFVLETPSMTGQHIVIDSGRHMTGGG